MRKKQEFRMWSISSNEFDATVGYIILYIYIYIYETLMKAHLRMCWSCIVDEICAYCHIGKKALRKSKHICH